MRIQRAESEGAEGGSQAEVAVGPAPGPWQGSFEVDGVDGGPVRIRQITKKSFLLESSISYVGSDTGLEGVSDEHDSRIRNLRLEAFPDGFETDLASVPGPTRWFMGSYGAHTPAAMIHDMLIPTPPDLVGHLTEQDADRYFRFMLQDLGVRWFKRWLMWSAVALRTRYAGGGTNRWQLILWVLASLAGISVFCFSALTGNWPLLLLSLAAPLFLSGLWGKQYGAGIIAAVAAPWFLPPTILAVVGYVVYWASEQVFGAFVSERTRGDGSLTAEGI